MNFVEGYRKKPVFGDLLAVELHSYVYRLGFHALTHVWQFRGVSALALGALGYCPWFISLNPKPWFWAFALVCSLRCRRLPYKNSFMA